MYLELGLKLLITAIFSISYHHAVLNAESCLGYCLTRQVETLSIFTSSKSNFSN